MLLAAARSTYDEFWRRTCSRCSGVAGDGFQILCLFVFFTDFKSPWGRIWGHVGVCLEGPTNASGCSQRHISDGSGVDDGIGFLDRVWNRLWDWLWGRFGTRFGAGLGTFKPV